MDEERRYAPLSALQHLVYCERQCALIHLERVWLENRLTAEGHVLHDRVHQESAESRPGVRVARALPVVSEKLALTGQCDVVEFHAHRDRKGEWSRVCPVEYKRGQPKSHDADRVQLCAQALCLEEMLQVSIAEGALFYGEPRRRTPVLFTPELRQTTRDASGRLHALLDAGVTPRARYQATLCRGCSLLEICLPERKGRPVRASVWFEERLRQLLEEE